MDHAAVKPGGGQWLWRLLCRLRRSTVDGGGSASSPTTQVAAPSGSASALVARVALTRTVCHRWCAPGGDDPSLRRRGRRKVSYLARRSSSPAPLPRTRLSCNGLDRWSSHSSATWRCSAVLDIARPFERALRASAYLPDRAFSLRAMDRRLCPRSRRARAQRRCDRHDRHAGRHAQSRRCALIISPVTPKI